MNAEQMIAKSADAKQKNTESSNTHLHTPEINQLPTINHTPILKSKMLKPQLPQNYLERPELFGLLSSASLLIVSASAGSGKSTAVSAWIDIAKIPYVWYRLDSWDNDINQFLLYLAAGIAALSEATQTEATQTEASQTQFKSLADELVEVVNARMSMGNDNLMRAAISVIQQITGPTVWVFDDYHEVNFGQIHQFVGLLMEQMPENHKVCIISREDPPLGLARYRTQGRLASLREADFRLNVEETELLLTGEKGISGGLDAEQVRMLHRRTEGWLSGIQLTVQSLQGVERTRGQMDKFIEAYQESSAYMMEYLLEEVLERQSDEVRRFLMQTAVFDDFCPELVDYTLQLADGESLMQLRQLVKSNCFILPTELGWYRYHQLFRELLLQRLKVSGKDTKKQNGNLEGKGSESEVDRLFQRAGSWFEARGQELEAIHYYLEGSPLEAARLVERMWSRMDLELRSEAWLKLAERLPRAVVNQSPVLTMGWGWALLNRGDLLGSVPWMDRAEALQKAHQSAVESSSKGEVDGATGRQSASQSASQSESLTDGQLPIYIFDRDQYEQLPATILSAKAYMAASEGNFAGLFDYNEQLRACSATLPYQRLWVIDSFVSTLHWAKGDLDQAIREMTKVQEKARQQLPLMVQGTLVWVIAAMQIEKGDLTSAQLALEQAMAAMKDTSIYSILAASYTLYLADIAAIRGDLAQGFRELARSEKFGHQYDFMDWRQTYERMRARLYCMQGLSELAMSSVVKGRKFKHLNPMPDLISFDDLELWTQLMDLSAPTHQSNSRAKTHLQAELKRRLLHLKGTLMEPLGVGRAEGARVESWAESRAEGRVESRDASEMGAIPYTQEFRWKLLMRYWSPELCGSSAQVYGICRRLLARAKDQGRRLHELEFTLLAARLTTSERERQQYERDAERLAEPEHLEMPFILWGHGSGGAESGGWEASEAGVRLSGRELELLQLIERGYSNEQIGEALKLSLSTVKSYNNTLFVKLGVKRRTEALAKARALGLL